MKTALIVGASRGIGLEFVRQYRAADWRVFATARRSADLDRLIEHGAEAITFDVARPDTFGTLASRLGEQPLDVAIFCAGVYGPDTRAGEVIEPAAFDEVMHVNVRAPLLLLPTVLPRVEAAHGKLVVISSRMGSIGEIASASGVLYRASKAALNAVLKATSVGTRQATCLALHPGWVRTDMGGAEAALDVSQSVQGMRRVIDAATRVHNGHFMQYDGAQLPW